MVLTRSAPIGATLVSPAACRPTAAFHVNMDGRCYDAAVVATTVGARWWSSGRWPTDASRCCRAGHGPKAKPSPHRRRSNGGDYTLSTLDPNGAGAYRYIRLTDPDGHDYWIDTQACARGAHHGAS